MTFVFESGQTVLFDECGLTIYSDPKQTNGFRIKTDGIPVLVRDGKEVSMNIEHPDITAAQIYGYPNKPVDFIPECPVCGRECNDYYVVSGTVVGCDKCVKVHDALEFQTEFM